MVDKSTRLRGVSLELQQAALSLRRGETPAEQVLWEAIRGRKAAGLKFRRQHSVGQFVLDFFCPECALVVELDGGVHEHQQEQGAARTRHLGSYGYTVIRFRNEDVLNDLPGVLRRISEAASPSDPPP